MARPLLHVDDLRTQFQTESGTVRAVDGVSFAVDSGETLCIVGESGSGKTVTSESITRLIPAPPGEIASGSVRFDGRELTDLDDAELRDVRGGEISHVFQNPQGALNPVYTIGWQIVEAIRLHDDVPKETARRRAIDLLDRVGIPEATARFDDYPHELSGGMKQRAVIAMALASRPKLLIADEPTTALDVTIQAQILDLLRDVQEEYDMAIILVTHDLGVVAEMADRVVVMYAGKTMEVADVYDLFDRPSHPYTRALLDCMPGRGERSEPIGGSLPSLTAPPDGCRFAPRCEYAVDACHDGDQPPMHDGPGRDHRVSCVHYEATATPRLFEAGADRPDEAATDGGTDAASDGGRRGPGRGDATEAVSGDE